MSSTSLSKTECHWIERKFYKRECSTYVPNTREPGKCGCGLLKAKHPATVSFGSDAKWSPDKHTSRSPTDAHGTIEFQGGPHPAKAQYVRLSNDSSPATIYHLLKEHWCLRLPNLLVTVHGGIANFDLQSKLKRTFDRGLLRAAKTTGAWIITGGINTGVVKQVGEALGDSLVQSRNNIVTIGIAPWGVIHNRNDLIGSDHITPYHAVRSARGSDVVVSGNHSYFLLVDNGSIGKFGMEIGLRKKLEKYASQQAIPVGSGSKKYGTPLVCLVLEGGANIIRTVLEFVTDKPPVPVVVADGSGRAADLLAFTHKYSQEDGTMPENLRDQLIATIERTFKYSRQQAEKVFIELMLCVRKKELITVFRISEDNEEIDLAILTALLKSQKYDVVDQLALTLTWNRADIARSHIFVTEQDWPELTLHQAMMDALVHDRVDFVQLLLENGVDMQKWLTVQRLEELYNNGLRIVPAKPSSLFLRSAQKHHPAETLLNLIQENKKNILASHHYTLQDIGIVIEKLMGGAYNATYCRRRFRVIYNTLIQKEDLIGVPLPRYINVQHKSFRYPFSELMIWAVLFQRQAMAKFMWQHGEEALAKALVAMKIYKSLTHEAEQNDLEIDVTQKLKSYSREFANLATDLLEHCYTSDDDIAQQLLTYELCNFSDATCLSLAVLGNHREFLANSSCQILLTDMWMGGLRMSKYINLKVILGILVFPFCVCLEYKTKEELQLMPQTIEEHIHEMEDSDSDSSDDSSVVVTKPQNPRRESTANDFKTPLQPLQDGLISMYDIRGSIMTRKDNPLSLGKKIYEFYTAPITKFWSHTFGFVIFLIIYTFFVLAQTPQYPSWLEYYIILYVFSLTVEKIRQMVLSEPNKFIQKLAVYFSRLWNICDAIAIVLFMIAVILRCVPSTLGVARVFYCVDIVLWYVRVLDLFSVNKHLGPYTMMIGKMLKDMLYFIIILLLMMVAFGILRQSVTFPNKQLSWQLFWNVFHEPYFMLYGEVYAGDIDPPCSDEPGAEFQCVPGRWVVPAVMALYLIVANILLINLLIAVFNNTFQLVNSISNQVWKFQRYSLVIEFESRPILPPPAIIICHVYQLIRLIYRKCRGKAMEYLDNGLKLFLDDPEVEKLHDFEEECVGEYFSEKSRIHTSSADERIRVTTHRVENVSLKLDDLSQKENSIKLSLQTVDRRLGKVEESVKHISQAIDSIVQHLSISSPRGPASAPGTPGFISDTEQNSPAIEEEDEEEAKSSRAAFFLNRDKELDKSEARLRPFTDYKKRKRPPYLRAKSLGSGSLEGGPPALPSQARYVPYHGHRNSLKGRDKQEGGRRKVGNRPASIKLSTAVRDTHRLSPVIDTGSLSEIDLSDCSPLIPLSINTRTTRDSPTSKFEHPMRSYNSVDGAGENSPQARHVSPTEGSTKSKFTSMPINSVVTPTRVEYTSITDDIDTSCVDDQTPQASPSAAVRFSFGVDVDVGLYTRRHPSMSTAEEKLHSAENSHHTQLEDVIKRRMRQISLTEHDSLGDLAKHVISVEEEEEGAGEPHIHSDEEDLHASHGSNTLSVNWGDSLKPSKSEPFLPQGEPSSPVCSGLLPGQDSDPSSPYLSDSPLVTTDSNLQKLAKSRRRGKRCRTASESNAI